MDDTYYRLKYYISDKVQIAYGLNHYEMAKDRLFTSSILDERTLDYNTSKILAGKDSKYMDTYMDISYLTIYKSVEMYEDTNKIVSRYKKLVKDEFSDVREDDSNAFEDIDTHD